MQIKLLLILVSILLVAFNSYGKMGVKIDQGRKLSTIGFVCVFASFMLLAACHAKTAEEVYVEYVENFYRNLKTFEKLEQMQREDIEMVYEIDLDKFPEPVNHKNGTLKLPSRNISNERWSEYKQMLKQAGVEYLLYILNEPTKRMVRFGKLDVMGVGYVYMEYPPPKFFNSMKECKPIMPSESCYILLKKNWYLYKEKYRLEQE